MSKPLAFKFPETPGYICLEDEPFNGVQFQSWPEEIVYGIKANFESTTGDAKYQPHNIRYINTGSSLDPINFSLQFQAGADNDIDAQYDKSQNAADVDVDMRRIDTRVTGAAVDRLHKKVARLASMALVRVQHSIRPGDNPYGPRSFLGSFTEEGSPQQIFLAQAPVVLIVLGDWVTWRGHLEHVNVTAKGPWYTYRNVDGPVRTAKPMRFQADISFLPLPEVYLHYDTYGPTWLRANTNAFTQG